MKRIREAATGSGKNRRQIRLIGKASRTSFAVDVNGMALDGDGAK
ncbi:MAG: hypothetical protein ACP5SH_15765 [Syntrophobacteraceae bacterium]